MHVATDRIRARVTDDESVEYHSASQDKREIPSDRTHLRLLSWCAFPREWRHYIDCLKTYLYLRRDKDNLGEGCSREGREGHARRDGCMDCIAFLVGQGATNTRNYRIIDANISKSTISRFSCVLVPCSARLFLFFARHLKSSEAERVIHAR